MSETSGNFRRLLVSLCAAARDESGIVDQEAAHRDATELLRAGELRAGTDESTFNMIFCQRNYGQIKLICDEYQRMTGHGLEKAIRNEFSGDIMVYAFCCTTITTDTHLNSCLCVILISGRTHRHSSMHHQQSRIFRITLAKEHGWHWHQR